MLLPPATVSRSSARGASSRTSIQPGQQQRKAGLHFKEVRTINEATAAAGHQAQPEAPCLLHWQRKRLLTPNTAGD
jgi:hypothetical protein